MDDRDRVNFLQRLGENITETRSSVYAWVLMSNHVHILYKSDKEGRGVRGVTRSKRGQVYTLHKFTKLRFECQMFRPSPYDFNSLNTINEEMGGGAVRF